jgi:methylenetetrahydrofolate dehydrogenase (NADP+)/methenyltetrahydrofolate cyclohydrolase
MLSATQNSPASNFTAPDCSLSVDFVDGTIPANNLMPLKTLPILLVNSKMKIIDGKKIADGILAKLKERIKKDSLKPCLAVILVGDNPASRLYVQRKEEAAQRIGIEVKKYLLPKKVSEEEILKIIDSLNQDKEVDGILIQMPLPKGISPDRIIRAINPEKDVDGFLEESEFDSPFILAIWQALEATGEDLKNKKAVALVNSDVFGERLCRFLKRKGLKAEYFLGVHLLKDLGEDLGVGLLKKEANILITALGQSNFIKGSMIKQGVILIDGGISKKGKRVIGDVDFESVKEKAKWLSPVPGGLGPLTVAFLLKNVVLAAE